jgi:hypothetical protein
MTYTTGDALEAFCLTCPPAEDVTSLLQAYGFELAFHMDIDVSPQYEQIPPLPAQFHFQDKHGNEVIFLAGRDTNLDGVQMPEHASRFWLYPGADRAAYHRVAHLLSARWSFAWRSSLHACQDVA